MVAAGKTPRQIAEQVGVSSAEAAKLAYDLLDSEVVKDTEQHRNLQMYRLERIVESLWERVQKHADRDDVRNLLEVLKELNGLMGLYKEANDELYARMHQHQFAVYMASLTALVAAFRALAPDALESDEAWATWGAEQLVNVQQQLELEQ